MSRQWGCQNRIFSQKKLRGSRSWCILVSKNYKNFNTDDETFCGNQRVHDISRKLFSSNHHNKKNTQFILTELTERVESIVRLVHPASIASHSRADGKWWSKGGPLGHLTHLTEAAHAALAELTETWEKGERLKTIFIPCPALELFWVYDFPRSS